MTGRPPRAPVVVRTANEGDADGVLAIARELVADGTTYVFAPETTDDELRAYWLDPRARRFVAVVGGEVAGLYLLRPNQAGRGSHVANASYAVAQRCREIGVKQIVVRRLEMPLVFAGGCIEREDRRRIEIVARTIAAIKASAWITDGHEDDAALGVERHEAPEAGATAIFPAFAPCVVARLTGLRHGVEAPRKLSGFDIKCLRIAGWSDDGAFAFGSPENHEVLVNRRR